jgi:hypothetical protein
MRLGFSDVLIYFEILGNPQQIYRESLWVSWKLNGYGIEMYKVDITS